MNPPPATPAASSDFDLEKGRQTEGYEDRNADPKEVHDSEKSNLSDGCDVHIADPKEVLVRLQSTLYDGTLSRLPRLYQILQPSMLKDSRIAEASIPARASEVQRQDTIGPYQRALC
jgi:hypothetical protein